MDIIASRRHFNVTNKDIVMFNGACYQIITQSYRKSQSERYYVPYDELPIIPNNRANKWIKEGMLRHFLTKTESGLTLTFYKFNVEE